MARGFEKNGCEVKIYVPQVYWELTLMGRIHFRMTTSLRKVCNKRKIVYVKPEPIRRKESQKVFKVYNEFEPDILVDFASYYLEADVLKQMDKCKKIIWIYDSMARLPHLYEKLKYYDQVYYFEGSDKQFFEEYRIKATFLPLCADDKVYYPIEKEKNIDVSFVGNLSYERIQFLLDLKKAFPSSNFKVYGRIPILYSLFSSNKKILKEYSNMFMNCYISPENANDLYAESKICINVHNGQTKYGANMRFFEIMAAGGFEIVDENEYITENYKNCVVTYSNMKDLIEKIQYYMSHSKEREQIAKRGNKVIVMSGLFYHRAKYILDNI